MENYDDADFFIFTGDTDISGAAAGEIETGRWLPWNDHTHVWYATERNKSQEFTKQSAILKPDVIFMIGMYSWHFTLVPLIYGKAPKKIISVRGMLHPGALGQKSRKKKIFFKVFQSFGFHHKVVFHATDSSEEQYIRTALGKDVEVFVAGNFPTVTGLLPAVQKQPGTLKLISVALVSPMKNILRVIHALREITYPVDYDIYGAIKDDEYWEKCRKAIQELPVNIRVRYRKAVTPENIPGVLSQYHVFILPSESENFGHAIFEALSAGRPVITSYNTPFAELKENSAGVNVYPEVESDIVAGLNLFLEMDEVTYKKWSEAAFQYALDHFDKKRLVEEYHRMFG